MFALPFGRANILMNKNILKTNFMNNLKNINITGHLP
jgi:hypothetical protein